MIKYVKKVVWYRKIFQNFYAIKGFISAHQSPLWVLYAKLYPNFILAAGRGREYVWPLTPIQLTHFW